MSSDELVVERGRVAVVRINRPQVHNALHSGLAAKLAEAVTGLADDGGVRAIVLTGTGEKAFSAGADLNELTGLDNAAATRVLAAGQAAFRAVEQSEVPVIAAVNGLALGGGFELALACSFPVLAERASLGLPETGLGLIPGYGGTQRLARVAGPAVARFVALTGRRVKAGQAHQWGITPVPPVPGDQLLEYAIQLATEIADRGPRAAAKVLRLIDLAADQTLDGGLSMETRLAADAVSSAEGAEGIRAFTARETPKFEARR
ncbi:putative enoyl-CoA hydratase [Frankia sp. Hr75.2]|nr:putative enoyl-CoA hydratase [Frankia sp. Hr75.2]